jgi:hypothetical protein
VSKSLGWAMDAMMQFNFYDARTRARLGFYRTTSSLHATANFLSSHHRCLTVVNLAYNRHSILSLNLPPSPSLIVGHHSSTTNTMVDRKNAEATYWVTPSQGSQNLNEHCDTSLTVDRLHDIGSGVLTANVYQYFGLLDSATDPAWLAQIELEPTPEHED